MKKEINKESEPLKYVKGFTEFLGCKIDLSKKPLIPRPETEYWVEWAIAVVKDDSRGIKRCLDLFSGSGCIGISILKNDFSLLCDMADSQLACLEQVKINCELNGIVSKRYRIIRSDVFSNIKKKYDFIFANPPYVAENRRREVQKSVLNFEPHIALFGGKDGLFYIRKFLSQSKKHLNKNGVIFMEFDWGQKKEIEKLIKKYEYSSCKFFKDQYNRWRWTKIII